MEFKDTETDNSINLYNVLNKMIAEEENEAIRAELKQFLHDDRLALGLILLLKEDPDRPIEEVIFECARQSALSKETEQKRKTVFDKIREFFEKIINFIKRILGL